MWEPIRDVPGLHGVVTLVNGGFENRTAAFSLPGGRLLVINPSPRLTPAHLDELTQLGTPAFVLAPNHYHHMGVDRFLRRYPDAVVVTSARAIPRLRKRVQAPLLPLEGAPEIQTLSLVPPGLKTGEVWLRLPATGGSAWLVTDAFFNVARAPRGLVGLLLRATKTVPGLAIGTTFAAQLDDRKAYRSWLEERLEQDEPRVLIPAHGDVMTGPNLDQELRRILQLRL